MKGATHLKEICKLPMEDKMKIFQALKANLLNEVYKDYDNKISTIRGGYMSARIKKK
jgi:hypothetical protein